MTDVLYRNGVKWRGGQDMKQCPIKDRRPDFAVRIKNGAASRGDKKFYLSAEGICFHKGIEEHLYCCSLQTFLLEIGEAFDDDIEQLPDIGDII